MIESAFFQDLAVLTVLAGVVAAVFSRLGWPKALGYILVGVLMSEHTWGGAFLLDADSIRTLSQLGVVFLMFGMGLNFSVKDMKKMKSVAVPSAVVDAGIMIFLGWLVGTKLFHWNNVQALFLGVAICDSATTLLAKVIDEMGWGRRAFAKYVLGTSVCEDILCVGAIAVATGCAQGGGMSIGAFATSLGWLALFFVSVLVVGIVLVPRLLQVVGSRKDNEALLLVTLACCFLVAYVAYRFDFSSAIGAFLVGLVCATSVERTKIDALVDPLKSMFSAMFFVTIGLLVNPASLWHCLPQILVVSLVVVVGKGLNNTVMSLVTGLDVKTSVQNGLSLAQVGEFAFMTAILYAGLVDDPANQLFPIAVGASLLTTLLNPVMIRLSDRGGDFAVHRMSHRTKLLLSAYQSWLEKVWSSKGTLAYVLARRAAAKILVIEAVTVAVGVACVILSRLDYSRFSVIFERWSVPFFFLFFNLFVVTMLPLRRQTARSLANEVTEMVVGDCRETWRRPVQRTVRMFVRVLLAVVGAAEVLSIDVIGFSSSALLTCVVAAVMGVTALSGWRFFVYAGRKAANRLYEALTEEDRRDGTMTPLSFNLPEGEIGRLKLDPASPAVDKSLDELGILSQTGVCVISVRRGDATHHDVTADWICRAEDILIVMGDSAKLRQLEKSVAPGKRPVE